MAPEHGWLVSITRAEEHFSATLAKIDAELKAASS